MRPFPPSRDAHNHATRRDCVTPTAAGHASHRSAGASLSSIVSWALRALRVAKGVRRACRSPIGADVTHKLGEKNPSAPQQQFGTHWAPA